MSRIGKIIETEGRSDVAKDWARRGHTRDWVWGFFGGNYENVTKLDYRGGCRTL